MDILSNWLFKNCKFAQAAETRSNEQQSVISDSVISDSVISDDIKTDPQKALQHAIQIKARWPEGEKAIASNPNTALEYAKIYGAWSPEIRLGRLHSEWANLAIENIASNAKIAFEYARDVLKAPFQQGRQIILSSPYADSYLKLFGEISLGQSPLVRKYLQKGPAALFDVFSKGMPADLQNPEGRLIFKKLLSSAKNSVSPVKEVFFKLDPGITEQWLCEYPENALSYSLLQYIESETSAKKVSECILNAPMSDSMGDLYYSQRAVSETKKNIGLYPVFLDMLQELVLKVIHRQFINMQDFNNFFKDLPDKVSFAKRAIKNETFIEYLTNYYFKAGSVNVFSGDNPELIELLMENIKSAAKKITIPLPIFLNQIGKKVENIKELLDVQAESHISRPVMSVNQLKLSEEYNTAVFKKIQEKPALAKNNRSLFVSGQFRDNASANEAFISDWVGSSIETNSIAYGYAIAKNFGSENTDSLENTFKYVKEMDSVIESLRKHVSDLHKITQKNITELIEAGQIKKTDNGLKLYRGVDSVYLTPRPIESWTSSRTVADQSDFGDCIILSTIVPIEAILTNYLMPHWKERTDEKEYVVIRNFITNSEITIEEVKGKCLRYRRYVGLSLDKLLSEKDKIDQDYQDSEY